MKLDSVSQAPPPAYISGKGIPRKDFYI